MNLITDSKVSDGKRWYCRVRKGPHSHEHRLTIRTDTFFSKSNMTLEEIVQFIYLWVHGNSQDTIAHELGTSSNTDVDWASFCREVCEETLMRRSEKIGGKDVVVEIDESKFAKRKYNVGHRVTGGWVFVGREKNDKTKIFMEPVEDRTADTLLAIIQKWILPGSIIWSDCWKAYGKIPNLPEGYKHGTVNHSTNFVNPETGVCTNHIESDWRHASLRDCQQALFGIFKYFHLEEEEFWKISIHGTHSRHCCDLPRAMPGSISIISAEYLLKKIHCKYVNSYCYLRFLIPLLVPLFGWYNLIWISHTIIKT